MRGLNEVELAAVYGGLSGPEPSPAVGVPQWQWDELMRMLEEQNRRNQQR